MLHRLVNDYLDSSSRRPWIYGGGEGGFRGHDCTLWAANWALAVTGNDPADDLRETYSTREAAEAIVAKAGGFAGLMGSRLVSSGWKSLKLADDIAFVDGTIAVISVPLGGGHHFEGPAIRHGNHWLVADPRGVIRLRGSSFVRSAWVPA